MDFSHCWQCINKAVYFHSCCPDRPYCAECQPEHAICKCGNRVCYICIQERLDTSQIRSCGFCHLVYCGKCENTMDSCSQCNEGFCKAHESEMFECYHCGDKSCKSHGIATCECCQESTCVGCEDFQRCCYVKGCEGEMYDEENEDFPGICGTCGTTVCNMHAFKNLETKWDDDFNCLRCAQRQCLKKLLLDFPEVVTIAIADFARLVAKKTEVCVDYEESIAYIKRSRDSMNEYEPMME